MNLVENQENNIPVFDIPLDSENFVPRSEEYKTTYDTKVATPARVIYNGNFFEANTGFAGISGLIRPVYVTGAL